MLAVSFMFVELRACTYNLRGIRKMGKVGYSLLKIKTTRVVYIPCRH